LQEHAAAEGSAIGRGTVAAGAAGDTAAGQRSVALDCERATLLDENIAARAKTAAAAQGGVGIRRSAAAEATGTVQAWGVTAAAAEATGTTSGAAATAEPALAPRPVRRTATAAAETAAARAARGTDATVDAAASRNWTSATTAA
jgi:hypothetical protein